MSYTPAKFEKPDPAWGKALDAPQENFLGITGFVVSILGLVFTCGILSPIGLLISLAGLFSRPRGYAIAGVVTGLLGSLWIVMIVAAFWVTAAVGVAAAPAVGEAIKQFGETATNVNKIVEAKEKVEAFRAEHERLPDGIEGNRIVAEFKDSEGNPLRYELSEDEYVIRSAGADGKFETHDDIDSTNMDAFVKALEEAKREQKAQQSRREKQGNSPQAEAPEIELPEIEMPELETPKF
jgi:hypothetical protein